MGSRAVLAVALVASVTLVGVVLGRGGADTGTTYPIDKAPASPPPTTTGVAWQALWNPLDLEDAPRSSIAFTELLGPAGRLEPDVARGANPVQGDPMPGVVVAWAEKGAAPRLLGTDGRWRSAPESMETNRGTPYDPDPPVISSDGTKVVAAADDGIEVLDVATGKVSTIAWPRALAPPWDWAPRLQWLPGDAGLLVLHWKRPWIIGLDGAAAPAPYPTEESGTDVFGISPDRPIYQNDYPRNTLLTWEGDEVVHEAPFPQCERLTAAYGLVACTAGSMRSEESGPVVVDAGTGEIVAYAPVRDPNAIYSDNGYLTTLGFLDPETVLLKVRPRALHVRERRTEAWHLIAWRFREGAFERVATAKRGLHSVSVAPSLMD